MDTAGASGTQGTQLLVHNASSARTVANSSDCSLCCCLCAFIVDLVTIVLLLVLLPVLLCIIGPLILIPVLDRLFHPGRKYMDGISSAYVNLLPEGVIHGMVVSSERVSAETVFAKFDATYVSSGRQEFYAFEQRMVQTKVVWPYWAEPSVPFDRSYHFRPVQEHLTKAELEARVAQIQTELLDFERPLWQLYHFENFTDEDGTEGSVTMLKIHHCVSDGFTGMRMLMQGAAPNKPPAEVVASGRAESRRRPGIFMLLHYWLVSVRKLLLMQPDAPNAFKAKTRLTPADPRTVAWSTLKKSTVSNLKQLGKSLNGATINDILMAALAGALRRHAEASNVDNLPTDITACGWVSQSPLKHIYADFDEVPFKWGNSTLGAFYVPLPVGAEARQNKNAVDALNSLRATTNNPALMVEAGVATRLLSLFGWLPVCIAKCLWGPLANKVSVSMSNIPGPQFQTEWCGNKVRRMLFFVPPTGSISLFVTIATWNGEVNVGMGVDSSLLSHDALLSMTGELFEAEIDELRRHVGVDV